MTDLEKGLRKVINETIGLNCDQWNEEMLLEGIVNTYKNIQDNIKRANVEHIDTQRKYKELAHKYIELRNLTSQFNNDFYKHLYGNEDPAKVPSVTVTPAGRISNEKSDSSR